MSGRVLRGIIWAGVGTAIFAGWFVVTRLVMTNDLRVWDIVALRFGGGTLVLLPVLLRMRRTLPWSAWREGLPLALLWGAPFVLLIALGLHLTSAAHASSITPGLMPLFAGAFAWMRFGERPTAQRFAGYAAILAGVVTLASSGAAGDDGGGVLGIAALIAAASMWALYTVRLRGSTLTAIQAAGLVCFWSTAVYLPMFVLAGLSHLSHATPPELAFQAVYQGALMSGLAIFAFNRAVALLGPAAASCIIALVPVIATVGARVFLGETPSPVACLAIGAIAFGVVLAAGLRRPVAPVVAPTSSSQGNPA